MTEWAGYPPATDETICEVCSERGHYWCRTSRVLFKGRGVPNVYPDDFKDWDDDEARRAGREEGAGNALPDR